MNQEPDEQIAIRNYLLGRLTDKEKIRQIEENLILSDRFSETLSIAEEKLVEEYLDGSLDKAETTLFREHFLAAPERRQELRFAQNIRKYAIKKGPKISVTPVGIFNFRALFSSPGLRFAVIILIVVAVGLGIYRIAFFESDTDKGLAQLRLVYHGQRPIEPRVSANFDYAPVPNLRGRAVITVDEAARHRAEQLLSGAAVTSNSAYSHQALGSMYLAKGDIDAALNEYNEALTFKPDDARLNNDIGALYLEKANHEEKDDKEGEALLDRGTSLKYIEKALQNDPKLLEALFNRALALQKLKAFLEAKKAWQDYLDQDPNSPWADEARRNLQTLSEQSKTKTPDDVLLEFMAAYHERDDDKAYYVVSRNREMITGKLVPQQLVFLFLNAPETDRPEYLKALIYIGRLENERSKDPFWDEMATFYAKVPHEKLPALKNAFDATQKGYEYCQLGNSHDAMESFPFARENFVQAGDLWNAQICDYWIAYCVYYLDGVQDSAGRMEELANLCKKKNYKWLSSQAILWQSVVQDASIELSRAINFADLSLKPSEDCFDFYQTNKIYSSLAGYQIELKQYDKALLNMAKVNGVIDSPDYSDRQKWRDFDRTAKLFYEMKLFDAAAAFEAEAFHLNDHKANDRQKDLSFEILSLANLSRIYSSQKRHDLAISFANQSKEAAAKSSDQAQQKKGIGFVLLQSAQMEYDQGNLEQSLADYDQAIDIYSSLEYRPYQYEAAKGRLLCNIARKDNNAIEREIPEVLLLFEKNRETIHEEQSRDIFFDQENNIYDTAIGYEFDKGQNEQAFKYAENSRARSLLDREKNDVQAVSKTDSLNTGKDVTAVIQPISLIELRSRLPEQVQLVYYSVLPDKVLIWLLTRDRFESFSFGISDQELMANVVDLINSIKHQDQERQIALSHSLYLTLVRPFADRLDPDKELFVVPDKVLCNLPFGALISDKTGNYLIADYRLSLAPSANAFLISTQNAVQRGSNNNEEKLLSIGNPDFDRSQFPGLESLPAAANEANQIATLYIRPEILLGPAATKSNIKASIQRADVVQFAGHYVVNEQSYLLSAFAIAGTGEDSRWTNNDLLQDRLDKPKLIILAACDSGIEGYYKGEGMIGASRTFLALGVPVVIASQWSVDSDATSELMVEFHRLRKEENLSPSSALRQAQIKILSSPNRSLRQPFYWAGFVAVGGYAQLGYRVM